MTDRQLLDEARTLFVAGHETTALTLTYALYLLASQSGNSDCVQAEIRWRTRKPPPHADSGDLPSCAAVRNVVYESLATLSAGGHPRGARPLNDIARSKASTFARGRMFSQAPGCFIEIDDSSMNRRLLIPTDGRMILKNPCQGLHISPSGAGRDIASGKVSPSPKRLWHWPRSCSAPASRSSAGLRVGTLARDHPAAATMEFRLDSHALKTDESEHLQVQESSAAI